jgi:hypothetical protein
MTSLAGPFGKIIKRKRLLFVVTSRTNSPNILLHAYASHTLMENVIETLQDSTHNLISLKMAALATRTIDDLSM